MVAPIQGPKSRKQGGRTGNANLSYMGVQAESPANFVTFDRNPTTSDFKNWVVGDEWENRTTKDVYKLVEIGYAGGAGYGTWVKNVNGLGNLSSLKDTAGTVVVGDALGTVAINGGELIDVTAGANSLDIDFSRGLQNGQIPIAAVGAATAYANITAGAGVTVTNGPNTITLSTAAAAGDLTIAADGGTAATSVAGTIKVQGTAGRITSTGDMADKVTLDVGADIALKTDLTDYADTFTTDAGSATPALGVLNVSGGQNINTSGAGNTTTVNINDTYQVTVDPATLEIGTVDSTQQLGTISIADLKTLLGLP